MFDKPTSAQLRHLRLQASGTITAEADISKAEIGSLIGRAYRCTLAETAVSAVTLNGAKLGPVGVEMK